MPHFGAPFQPACHQAMTSAVLRDAAQPGCALMVAIDPDRDVSCISEATLQALFPSGASGAVKLSLQLLTIPSPSVLQLTGGKAHISDQRVVTFEIVEAQDLPARVPAVIGKDYIRNWQLAPWGNGCILSRLHINCHPAP